MPASKADARTIDQTAPLTPMVGMNQMPVPSETKAPTATEWKIFLVACKHLMAVPNTAENEAKMRKMLKTGTRDA